MMGTPRADDGQARWNALFPSTRLARVPAHLSLSCLETPRRTPEARPPRKLGRPRDALGSRPVQQTPRIGGHVGDCRERVTGQARRNALYHPSGSPASRPASYSRGEPPNPEAERPPVSQPAERAPSGLKRSNSLVAQKP